MSIQHMQHDHPGLKIFRSNPNNLRVKQSGKAGFTAQTFMACIQSMTAIPELAKHLLERQSWFSVLLTGKLTSASLEGRFGWYHHSYGGNYLTSVKHLPHSKKRSTA